MTDLTNHLYRLLSDHGDLNKSQRGWVVATHIVPELQHIMKLEEFSEEIQ